MKHISAILFLAGSAYGQTVNPARCLDTSAAANTITCATPDGFPGSYQRFQEILLLLSNSTTGATTLNVNGLGAKTVIKPAELGAGSFYLLAYDGAAFQVLGVSSGGGSVVNAVTSQNAIPANALTSGQDGNRGIQGTGATVDASGNAAFPGSVMVGAGSGKTGTLEVTNSVSGRTFGFAPPDALASDYLYLPPPSPSTGSLQDMGAVPCPMNMPAGSPTACRQLATNASSGGGGGATFSPTTGALVGPAWALSSPPLTGWVWDNQGSSTMDTSHGYLYLTAAISNALSVRGVYRAAPSTPYSITILLDADTSGAPANGGGEISWAFGFRQSTTGKISLMHAGWGFGGQPSLLLINWNSSSSQSGVTSGTHGPVSISSIVTRHPIWLKIGDDGTSLTFQYSIDANNWNVFASILRGSFMQGGPDQIFLGADVDNGPVSEAVYSYAQGVN